MRDPRFSRVILSLFLITAFLIAAAVRPGRAACNGDCNHNNSVTFSELMTVVRLALSGAAPLACPNGDANGDGVVGVEDVVASATAAAGPCPDPLPIFPSDYRASFVEVRSCRIGNEHDFLAIRVLANPIAAQAYLEEQNPLPVGSIILKEEFDSSDCSDDDRLVRWSVMEKRQPGFDPVDGDWAWQRLRVDATQVFDGKSTCIACHRAPACTARDYMCTDPLEPPTPSLVFEELPATLWSIAGTSASDVYAVGGDPTTDDFGPYVLNYDGSRWIRLRTPVTGAALRWISVEPIDGAFYMAGDEGVILRFDLSSRTFTQETTPSNATLFGIWGSSADRLWAVGSDPANPNQDESGVLWSYDGTDWTVEDLSGVRPQGVPALFKVWGRSANDVYVVGQRGVILHYDGSLWQEIPSATERQLFTVHGNSRSVVAVGGALSGVIVELSGGEFVDRTPPNILQVNGVFIPEQGGGIAVGDEGSFAVRGRGSWAIQAATNTVFGYHATWVDPEGGVWAAGGDLSTDLKHGLVGYSGLRTISGQILDIDPCALQPLSGPATVSYATQIAPLFAQASCLAAGCHNGAQTLAASRYTMSSHANLFKRGTFANTLGLCPLVPGDPDASFLLEKLQPIVRANAGVRMPIGSGTMPLSEEEIDLVRTWILEGAQDN